MTSILLLLDGREGVSYAGRQSCCPAFVYIRTCLSSALLLWGDAASPATVTDDSLCCCCRHKLSHPPSPPGLPGSAQGGAPSQGLSMLSSPRGSRRDASFLQAPFSGPASKPSEQRSQHLSEGSQDAELGHKPSGSFPVQRSPYAGELTCQFWQSSYKMPCSARGGLPAMLLLIATSFWRAH